MRYPLLDGARGFFLLFMAIIHVSFITNGELGRLNHQSFGFVEDAQGFVFLSGVVLGIVQGRALLRRGASAVGRSVRGRIRTIWTHHAVLVAAGLLGALALIQLDLAIGLPAWGRPYAEAPALFTLSALGLAASSSLMDILPMYILFMALAPMALRAFALGRAASVLALSALAWTLGQTGLAEVPAAWVEWRLAKAGHALDLGHFFNLLAWQALFFGGLWLGFAHVEGRLDLQRLHTPPMRALFRVAAIALACFALFDMTVRGGWLPDRFLQPYLSNTARGDLDALHAANFLAALYVATWLLVAGQHCGRPAIETCARLLRRLFASRPLVFLGQHSLHVFSFHVLACYAVEVWASFDPPQTLLARNLPIVLVAASLFPAAWGHAWLQSRHRRAQDMRANGATLSAAE